MFLKKTYLHIFQYPTELLHVNLAFNRLEEIPTFALRVRHQLQTLILRNNNLDNIDGIEELCELHELDLSQNCLSDHNKLYLLCYLHKLQNVSIKYVTLWICPIDCVPMFTSS
jgi:Leucine-rich repeat (LRR) protein